MLNTLRRLVCVSLFTASTWTLGSPTPLPSDYFISPTLTSGQRVSYGFDFVSPPVSSLGPANMLILNTGSANLHVQTVTTSLYIDSQFIGAASWSTGTAFALFAGATSGYLGIFPSTSVSDVLLESLFAGHSVGTLVIEPEFNDPAGVVTFSGLFLHAGTAKPADPVTGSWEDIYPSARILSETVLTVPEPGTLALLALGLAGLAYSRRQR